MGPPWPQELDRIASLEQSIERLERLRPAVAPNAGRAAQLEQSIATLESLHETACRLREARVAWARVPGRI